jgi:uncharacterized protein (DUF2236 family)
MGPHRRGRQLSPRYQRYGAGRLDHTAADGYVADAAKVASALGVPDPPTTRAELAERLAAYRPELRGTAAARETARFLLLNPPLPLAARPPYAVLAASAVALLPRWARRPLQLPYLPLVERTGVTVAGRGLVSTIRWAMTPPNLTRQARTQTET